MIQKNLLNVLTTRYLYHQKKKTLRSTIGQINLIPHIFLYNFKWTGIKCLILFQNH